MYMQPDMYMRQACTCSKACRLAGDHGGEPTSGLAFGMAEQMLSPALRDSIAAAWPGTVAGWPAAVAPDRPWCRWCRLLAGAATPAKFAPRVSVTGPAASFWTAGACFSAPITR